MKRVGIFGSTGRVGQRLIENLKDDRDLKLTVLHAIEDFTIAIDEDIIVTNDVNVLLENCDVVIEFSLPAGTEELLDGMKKNPTALVSGTTGLSGHQLNMMKDVANSMPILHATNMSMGVAVLNKLVEQTSSILRDFDIEIVEQHHRYKKDAPSGTALTLGEHAAKGRGLNLDDVRISGRNGDIGERSKDEIAVMAIRGGDVVGRHTAGFYNDGEFLELHHTATNRDTFVHGAIKAAKWVTTKESGIYKITDCLGL